MGRNFSKGYWKLAESKVWYNHYGALIYGASPASARGVLLAVSWAGINYSVSKLCGVNGYVRLYMGDNPDTGNHELWLGLTGEDGTSSEFIIKDGTTIEWDSEKKDILPSYSLYLDKSLAIFSDLGELMNNLKLFPFMGMADISEGGDANELESGYYINGNFRKLTNSPFSSGWGGIIVFKINYYTLQIASDMNTKIFKVRQRWYNTWDDWKTVSLT